MSPLPHGPRPDWTTSESILRLWVDASRRMWLDTFMPATTAPAAPFYVEPTEVVGEPTPGNVARRWVAVLHGREIARGVVGELDGVAGFRVHAPFVWTQEGHRDVAEAWDALGSYLYSLVEEEV